MRLFDAHNHLQEPELDDGFATIIAELRKTNVVGAAVNGTYEGDWDRVAALAATHSWIRPQVGIHPWHVGNRSEQWEPRLRALLEAGAGLGEVGVDRWMVDQAKADDWRLTGLRRAPIEEQEALLKQQIALAVPFDRPVTLHCLHAWSDLERILAHTRMPSRGFLLHAFSGPEGMIGTFAEQGAYFSFNAVLLAPTRARAAAAFTRIPLDRIVVETDAPSMPPPPEARRYELTAPGGQPLNHPANLAAAYEGLARILGISIDALAEETEGNFSRLFGTPAPAAP